jgi:hypothetical protein
MACFRRFTLCLLLFFPVFLFAQQGLSSGAVNESSADPGSFIGLTLDKLLARFGTPKSVYAVRGAEEWQDDVVFLYDEGDFYVYKDRVWQVKLKAAYKVRIGDPKPAALLALEGELVDAGSYIIKNLPAKGWPLALRINLDSSGFVSGIFVYRSDF